MSEPTLLAAFLAENDAPCPACGYNLRGLTAAACPECAAAIRLDLHRDGAGNFWRPWAAAALAWPTITLTLMLLEQVGDLLGWGGYNPSLDFVVWIYMIGAWTITGAGAAGLVLLCVRWKRGSTRRAQRRWLALAWTLPGAFAAMVVLMQVAWWIG